MDQTQSNTQRGPIVVPANVDLTGMEGRLAVLANDSGVAKAALPAALTDVACYLIIEGNVADADVTLQPLEPGQQIRVPAKSTTLVPGDKVVAYASGSEGMLTEYTAGDAFIVGIAEEVGAAENQLVLIRPLCTFLNND